MTGKPSGPHIATMAMSSSLHLRFFLCLTGITNPVKTSQLEGPFYKAVGHCSDIVVDPPYLSARSIPPAILDLLQSQPRRANIILFSALRILQEEETEGRPSEKGQFWLVCRSAEQVDFVLSCTNGPLGTYPICIYTPHPADQMTESFCRPRLNKLVNALHKHVDQKRVFSVFAFETVSRIFAEFWKNLTGLDYVDYYAAKQAFCTKATFIKAPLMAEPERDNVRLAVEKDIEGVAELCFRFAQDSDPFFLTREGAMKEANYLVKHRRVWVHIAKRPGASDEIASICAVTRESDTVSSITKVYTSPNWRKMGCARRLVSFVCETLLKTKESVVLYVGHSNEAQSVYARTGFMGLDDLRHSFRDREDGMDKWLEIGFDKDKVDLGHW
ncbi:hypothetical protein CCMSSC00406_0002844 [Pleurotus cornucopiae]|uniref:Uncharacterized protein n=1 Tax=Pleurotus cornucopiae TaxID=5321 RepID=A0ACB7IWB1_PLECO|nr:hypothetical protein CCMSSC00406_0002844 [Pleurotus cornucopiae]